MHFVQTKANQSGALPFWPTYRASDLGHGQCFLFFHHDFLPNLVQKSLKSVPEHRLPETHLSNHFTKT